MTADLALISIPMHSLKNIKRLDSDHFTEIPKLQSWIVNPSTRTQ